MAAGSAEILEIGDISVTKEWAFAGDIAEGIIALVSQDRVFEVTIGTGVPHSIGDWLEACFRLAGLNWRDRVKFHEGFVADYRSLLSDPSTIRALGWHPRVNFPQLAAMMMEAPDAHHDHASSH